MEKENLEKIIKISNSLAETLKNLGKRAAGGNFKTLRKYIDKYDIDISHFNPEKIRIEKLKKFLTEKKKDLSEILTKNSSYNRGHLKKRLYDEGIKECKCELCGQNEIWNGKKISLILDHINGVWDDNRIENIRIVCPNCNATLDTHCGKNLSPKNQKKLQYGFDINEQVDFRFIMTEEKNNINILKRKVDRPEYEVLLKEIDELGYSATGRKYGVSDNAIRKWVKYYEKDKVTRGSVETHE
jgi:hypothetical protein